VILKRSLSISGYVSDSWAINATDSAVEKRWKSNYIGLQLLPVNAQKRDVFTPMITKTMGLLRKAK